MQIDGMVPNYPTQPTDYDALNRIVRKHKAALTRATKKGPRAVILAVRDAFDAFDEPEMIWPDNWHDWARAFDDALFALRMEDFDPADPAEAELLTAVAKIQERRY